MNSSTENQLINILIDLNKIEGVESSLISDSNGNVICHSMSRRTDTSLFGPMAHVIISSSKRLLNSTNQCQIERILVESEEGKALFLHLGNVHFILLMEVSANVGFVMVSAKRAALKIVELTKDMVFRKVEETVFEEVPPKKIELDNPFKEDVEHEEIEETVEKITETEDISKTFEKGVGSKKLDAIMKSSQFKSLDPEEAGEKLTEILKSSEPEIKSESKKAVLPIEKNEIKTENEPEEIEILEKAVQKTKEPESSIPVIKPPISLPKLPDDVQIPETSEERINLILDIYESICVAMSIGASKIMGVAPAKGFIKRFLPLGDCKTLLKDVDVKSNSTIDFDKIRENIEDIPSDEREKILIIDFSKIIDVITENYGKVMGYGAFRGIVRTEFKVINNSYGNAMVELEIKDKMHPELTELFK